MTKSPRTMAVKVLQAVITHGQSLQDALDIHVYKDPRDQALVQALSYGVCRWFWQLEGIANQLIKKPLKQKDFDLYLLILIGLFQLRSMRIPAYAAIAETVASVIPLKKPWAKGLINATLREYQRNAENFNLALTRGSSAKINNNQLFSHPTWMIKQIHKDYPDDWENILENNNQHPPFSLRVNQQKISRLDYLKKLTEKGIDAEIIYPTQSGIMLATPMNVSDLPGFKEGEISVQDGAAQCAAEIIAPEPKDIILDACAAPGGKTAHMLEMQPKVEVLAVDHDAQRLQNLKENLTRLQLSAQCHLADVANPSQWWDGKLFDKILLDAPCSASGVIRRHPDIKLLRRESDIKKLMITQLQLLNTVWQLLKKNGTLLYATCSIFSVENENIIEQFIAENSDAKEVIIPKNIGLEKKHGKQILPGMQGMDGFFYAMLKKS